MRSDCAASDYLRLRRSSGRGVQGLAAMSDWQDDWEDGQVKSEDGQVKSEDGQVKSDDDMEEVAIEDEPASSRPWPSAGAESADRHVDTWK